MIPITPCDKLCGDKWNELQDFLVELEGFTYPYFDGAYIVTGRQETTAWGVIEDLDIVLPDECTTVPPPSPSTVCREVVSVEGRISFNISLPDMPWQGKTGTGLVVHQDNDGQKNFSMFITPEIRFSLRQWPGGTIHTFHCAAHRILEYKFPYIIPFSYTEPNIFVRTNRNVTSITCDDYVSEPLQHPPIARVTNITGS